ncbi:MAG: Gfo/Idh/MocA family oxidoreductase [Cyclobacteriaceae bacterium]|nr:Gfo/Idh/MocA family oxidoreductase [Cyclobacteriaceae bacterium]
MNYSKTSVNRRKFLRNLSIQSALLTSSPVLLASNYSQSETLISRKYEKMTFSANNQIHLALIGAGIQGIFDTKAALSVAGVKLVAVCDLYIGRLDRAKELWGADIFVSRDYREILARQDVDAVIIATPDHWHKRLTIEALQAKKAVYCEKPMVQNFDEGHEIISVQKETGTICQIGSQGLSSLGNEKAKQLYQDGAIGELVMLDMYNDRYSAEGAWQYPIPGDASPDTIDFDTFLGSAAKVAYDPTRFFRWRNYKAYGTGVAGDLFVHAFTTLNYVISSYGPNRAMATGGLRYWKDGRDVPDVSLTFYDYPQTETHAAFNAIFRVNFIAGGGGGYGFKLVGTEGEMEVGSDTVKLVRSHLNKAAGGYSLIAYTEAMQEEIRKEFEAKNMEGRKSALNIGETIYRAPDGYKGSHYDHFYNFFEAIRGRGSIVEDATFGFRAAGAALLANESYYSAKAVHWNPETMKLS